MGSCIRNTTQCMCVEHTQETEAWEPSNSGRGGEGEMGRGGGGEGRRGGNSEGVLTRWNAGGPLREILPKHLGEQLLILPDMCQTFDPRD